uniref:Acetaldehyde dehydrogenase n=1 Tax=Candidatus Kentrum sp. FM TaxID=2126340 RepID=A0A450W5C3_9GAMM|nr:MAG: acetaldehyde dehydrogenase [Candidatus Kentron sp. FM]VFJ59606.1 MAG: acetaldehyde dehydrogenase [Candidatus Kentron sp. FM]VFK12257.1 MAG: acetaldehyde dehydrogenase [Candidatus Kentron sp. FM]
MRKIPIAIFGNGLVALDLLSKITESPILECKIVFCRTKKPTFEKLAARHGVRMEYDLIHGFNKHAGDYEALFDCTSALAHRKYSPVFKNLDKLIINLTPEKAGHLCMPALNMQTLIDNRVKYFDMVSCGGQAGIPIIHAISEVDKDIEYAELFINATSESLGAGSRANIDEYIDTTEDGIRFFAKNRTLRAKAIATANNAKRNMRVTVYAEMSPNKIGEIRVSVDKMVKEVQKYVPGYKLLVEPLVEGDHIMVSLEIRGIGDFTPEFFGNVDIIARAAIQAAEKFFIANRNQRPPSSIQ